MAGGGRNTALALLFCALALTASAQTQSAALSNNFARRNMSGPRMGATYVLGDNLLSTEVADHEMGRLISQFGWAFEGLVGPPEGPLFVIQLIPLIAGVEYGMLIPSATLAMGVRFPGGWELSLGPSVAASGDAAPSSLMVSLGKSFDYGGVSVPFTLSYANNLDGSRLQFLIGYSVTRRR